MTRCHHCRQRDSYNVVSLNPGNNVGWHHADEDIESSSLLLYQDAIVSKNKINQSINQCYEKLRLNDVIGFYTLIRRVTLLRQFIVSSKATQLNYSTFSAHSPAWCTLLTWDRWSPWTVTKFLFPQQSIQFDGFILEAQARLQVEKCVRANVSEDKGLSYVRIQGQTRRWIIRLDWLNQSDRLEIWLSLVNFELLGYLWAQTIMFVVRQY